MKKLVLFCAALICAAAAVRAENDTKPFQLAKAVKLGRNINATTSYQSVLSTGTFAGSTELTETPESFECDANCQKCDETTGTCLLCALDRYISENLCLTCPEKNYCDGEKAIPNCTDVSGAKACRANRDSPPSPMQRVVAACDYFFPCATTCAGKY